MEKRLKFFNYLSLTLLIVASIWVVFNVTMYEMLRPKIVALEPIGKLENWAEFIWLGFLVFFVVHCVVFLTYIFHLQLFRDINLTKIVTLIVGVVSFFSIFGNWAIMGDIGKEYKAGLETASEWPFLYVFIIIHTVFYILMFPFVLNSLRKIKQGAGAAKMQKDEVVFKIAQYVGIICGLLGLAMISMQLMLDVPMWHIKSFGTGTVVLLLIPYGLIAGFWILIKSKEKISQWYDEKQWADVTKAGFTTLLLSVVAMVLVFILSFKSLPGGVFGILWLPFYLFFVLFVFSLLVLVFTNKT
jgi:hypothetical protein